MSVELCSIVVLSQAFGVTDVMHPDEYPETHAIPQICGLCHCYQRGKSGTGRGHCALQPEVVEKGHEDWCFQFRPTEKREFRVAIAGE